MSFITDTDLAEYVGTPTLQDTGLLQAAADAACRWAQSFCHRTFDVATTTASPKVFSVNDPYTAFVDDFATTTDLAITTDENDDGTFEVTWAAADYELEPFGATMADGTAGVYYRIRAVDSHWFPTATRRRGVLRVTARWGWPEVPAPVKQAALELGKDLYGARLTRGGVIVTDVGAVSVRTNRIASALLQPYVRMDRVGIA